MGFLGVKTHRKRLTGAVRSFLRYLFVISGRFGEKKFFDFFRPLFGPVSNHIGPNLTLSGTKSPNLCMYMSCCLIWQLTSSSVVTNISSYDPHTHTYLTFASGYQVSMCICRPDIYGFLSTRYLWVSVIFFFLSEGKAVGKFLIAILVLLIFLKSLLTIHNLFRPLGKPVSKLLIAIPVIVIFLKSLFAILGKPVSKFLIAIPVLVNFSKSLFAIHNLFRALGKPVSKFLIAIPVLLNLLKSLFTIHGVLRPYPGNTLGIH